MYIKPGGLKPAWIGNVLDDCSEQIQLEILDASGNPEGLQAFDAFSNEIWLDDVYPESSTFQEETGLSDNQNGSGIPYAEADEPLAGDIDGTLIFLEHDAELSPFICYPYNPNPQLTFEIDPILGASDTPNEAAIGDDYSVTYVGLFDDSPAPLTGDKPDPVDSFAEVLPWNESGKEPEIVICEPQIFPCWQSILPAEDLPGVEWSKIPKIVICFLPDFDNPYLFPQPYDVSTIDFVNEKVDGDGDGVGDVATIQDQDLTDASMPFRSGTATPLPWWRGYTASPPENLIWLDDVYPESSTSQEETGLSDNQNGSESPYTQTDEPVKGDIDGTSIFLEYDAELSPFICYAYNPNPQLTFEIDPISGTSDTPDEAAIGHDYSVTYAWLFDDSPAPLTGEKPDPVDSFAEVLPWNESGKEPEIAICEPQIFPCWQSILLAENTPGNEWREIPEIANCFLPYSDTYDLALHPYDVSTIDVVNEKVDGDGDGYGDGDGDVATIQDQDPSDASTPSRSGTTTPLPWWRGYEAALPENLSSQLLVPEELVENSDQDQPAPDSILDSDIPSLPVAISVAALAESEVTAVATIRNPNPAPKDAAKSDVFLQPYPCTVHHFAFETTGPAASSFVEPKLFIKETTSANTDLQNQSKKSDYVVDLILSFDSIRSSEFASPLLWLGPTRLTNLLNLPPSLSEVRRVRFFPYLRQPFKNASHSPSWSMGSQSYSVTGRIDVLGGFRR